MVVFKFLALLVLVLFRFLLSVLAVGELWLSAVGVTLGWLEAAYFGFLLPGL